MLFDWRERRREMTPMEFLTGMLILVGLATLRLGVPALITWLIGKLLKRAEPSAS
jgi:hypothetical protein